MHVDENEPLTDPLRRPGTGSGPEQSIMESFQRVLDALDAARAELHSLEPRPYGAAGSLDGLLRPAGGRTEEATTGAGGAEEHGWGSGPRTVAPAAAVTSPPVSAPATPPAVVVEPLWARGSGSVQPPDPWTRPTGPGTSRPDPVWPVYPGSPVPSAAAAAGGTGSAGGPGRPEGRAWPRLVAGRRARLAGACSVGAVGGLLVASSLLGNGAMGPGPWAPSLRPDRPAPGTDRPQEDARHPHGSVREDAGPQRRTYRIPRLRPGGESPGRYAIEVREAGARFQGPGFTA
ncbi:hypothetical protein ACF1G0_29275 [Streptomyces sp. NPDC013953]|uniref:hypothetical protein n=1 Tax=Streptomyces sp. NPDC013953 TaxID=3364868 RepID=UPI00370136CE